MFCQTIRNTFPKKQLPEQKLFWLKELAQNWWERCHKVAVRLKEGGCSKAIWAMPISTRFSYLWVFPKYNKFPDPALLQIKFSLLHTWSWVGGGWVDYNLLLSRISGGFKANLTIIMLAPWHNFFDAYLGHIWYVAYIWNLLIYLNRNLWLFLF